MKRRTVVLLLMILALVAAGCSTETSVLQGERIVLAEETPSEPEPTVSAPSTPTSDDDGDDGNDGDDEPVDPVEPEDSESPPPDDSESELPTASDAPQIEGLVTDCESGNEMACDILYRVTDRGSDEEAIALDCGGRGKPTGSAFCTEGLTISSPEEPDFFALSSPALPAITDACQIGDMTACDFLFWISPIGSEFETIGQTCAGRVEVASPDCRTLFGS